MRAEFVNPFLSAATEVLRSELGAAPVRGPLRMVGSRVTPGELTVVLGVTGAVEGMVLFGMSEFTGRKIVGHVLHRHPGSLSDQLLESGVGELGNMITGRATVLLEAAGYPCDITPPTVLTGRNVMISTIEFQRLVIPLQLPQGSLEIHVALQERVGERRGGVPMRTALQGVLPPEPGAMG